MTSTPRAKPFTGRHMTAILVVGFGIVVAVNFTMASYAVGGFHGVVVENSYIASQEFNGWLEDAEEVRALGWEAAPVRGEAGHVVVTTDSLPDGAVLTAELRRPIGMHDYASLTFAPLDDGRFRSLQAVDDGRWTIRLFITAGGQQWVEESELK